MDRHERRGRSRERGDMTANYAVATAAAIGPVVQMTSASYPSTMEITGIHHVSLNVQDVAEATNFYVDVLGFSVLATRPDFSFPGSWLQAGAQQVHLIGEAKNAPDRRQHFALQVDSLSAWMSHLDGLGVAYRHATYLPGAGDQIFLHDPWGNRIELNQPDVAPVP
jgi:catechol 2,3-dioxygenase-like lactoylglutathione lyase family enzyme